MEGALNYKIFSGQRIHAAARDRRRSAPPFIGIPLEKGARRGPSALGSSPRGAAVHPLQRRGATRVNSTCWCNDRGISKDYIRRQREGRVEKPSRPLTKGPMMVSGAAPSPPPGISGLDQQALL